jgi:hypothetical protein|tara:strand:+ start:39 stop:560 length:522 start_codon:yes stop_codon:yes gene_type:complete
MTKEEMIEADAIEAFENTGEGAGLHFFSSLDEIAEVVEEHGSKWLPEVRADWQRFLRSRTAGDEAALRGHPDYYQPKNYRIKREIDRELEAAGPDIIAAHRAEVSPTASPIGINEEGTGLGIEYLYPYDIDQWGNSLFTLEQLQSIQRIADRVGVEVDQIKTYLRYHGAGGSR